MPTDLAGFVPLTTAPASGGERQPFRILVAERPEQARPFQSPAPAPVPAHPAPQPGCEPRVSLQREGDRVTGIHIECSCGQIIELACVYQ
ncbi:MAG TPA: hypothetical protein VNT26_11045 [Candidatus Sulfotelmatobacter sp.]|nr:hypothetical protein [Candidatus Sulfotelmatobacter sp.]